MVIGVENYWLRVSLIPNSLKRALRELQSDYADILVFSTPSETKSQGYRCRMSEKWRVAKKKRSRTSSPAPPVLIGNILRPDLCGSRFLLPCIFGIVFLHTLRADAVTEIRFRMLKQVLLYLLPIIFVLSDFFAEHADGQKPF